jgi:hypothetical protein
MEAKRSLMKNGGNVDTTLSRDNTARFKTDASIMRNPPRDI